MVAANFGNATLWFIYGIVAIDDILLWLPNGVGMLLAIVQTLVILYARLLVQPHPLTKQDDGHRTDQQTASVAMQEIKMQEEQDTRMLGDPEAAVSESMSVDPATAQL
jgi:hypothetical protein